MADRLQIENDKILLTTDEGVRIERPVNDLVEMFQRDLVPPLDGAALPDGVKFIEWRHPFLLVVHQSPWQVRRLRWIHKDSPAEYGPGTVYRTVRLSLPYAITFALFCQHEGGLYLMDENELYFRNSPLRSKHDSLGYPALLNISRIPRGKRLRAWICTQFLRRDKSMNWIEQLTSLMEHCWNGGFNRSSEHHEGASWYGISAKERIHPALATVELWEQASREDEAFGISVAWKDVGMTVGELIECMFEERQVSNRRPRRGILAGAETAGLVSKFLNFIQKSKGKAKVKKAV